MHNDEILLSYLAMARADSNTVRHVAAELSPWQGYTRPALRGVLRYAAGTDDWELHSAVREHRHLGDPLADYTPRHMDGRIIMAVNDRLRGLLAEHPHPVVAIRDRFEQDRVPTVAPDNHAVGRMAAEHLLELGLRRLAAVGHDENDASRRRVAGFAEHAEQAGAEVRTLPEDAALGDRSSPFPAAAWLRSLPLPCGVFCWTDEAAHNTIAAIKAAGMSVPEDLAVVGVHNDDLICNGIRPTITSVALPLEQIGYEAATLLDRLMQGQAAPDRPIRFDPVEVVPRGSTDTTAMEDSAVLEAVAIIRRRAIRGLTVEQLCEAMDPPISRRTLERRFEQALGRSPHQQIRLTQCQHARELLINTDWTHEMIARRCGFSSNPFFSNTFKRVTGQRPGEYRQQRRRR